MATILVVEDDADNVVLLRRVLERAGHQVVTAADGLGGFAAARSWAPELILLDVSLAGPMTGLDLCRLIRATAEIAHTPVVMLSGWAFDSDLQAGRDAGANAYLAKPFDMSELTETVTGLLDRVTREER
jgi:DNA-binding response OmpR family regulator